MKTLLEEKNHMRKLMGLSLLTEEIHNPFPDTMSDLKVGQKLMGCWTNDIEGEKYNDINSDIEDINNYERNLSNTHTFDPDNSEEGVHEKDKEKISADLEMEISQLGKKWRNTDIGKTYCNPLDGFELTNDDDMENDGNLDIE